MGVLAVVCACLVVAGLAEAVRHLRRIRKIPIRVHVNGTRGKSTTARLIAAGLREAGLRVIAKTTGTAARLILEDGSERPVRRLGRPNIIEQVRTAAVACARRADALVVECMALHPENQWVSEHRMVRATVGVITNVRPDHLDVMGPGTADVAEVLSLGIPRGGHLVTAEKQFLGVLEERASALGTVVHAVGASDVPEAVEGFGPLAFAENVACALKVCELAGVDRATALRGMARAQDDPGALRVSRLARAGRSYVLVNAFAANDAASTELIWERFRDAGIFHDVPVVAVMNNRADRVTRVAELADLLVAEVRPDYAVLIGEVGRLARRRLTAGRPPGAGSGWGIDPRRVIDLTAMRDPESVLRAIDSLLAAAAPAPAAGAGPAGVPAAASPQPAAVLFGLGNTKGMGGRLADYFKQNGEALQ